MDQRRLTGTHPRVLRRHEDDENERENDHHQERPRSSGIRRHAPAYDSNAAEPLTARSV
jgi:hypothetical protein